MARKVRKTKTVTGPKPLKPATTDTERALKQLANKARKLGGRSGALKISAPPGSKAIQAMSLRRASNQLAKTRERLQRGNKQVSQDFSRWAKENPHTYKKLGMAAPPPKVSPIRARISELLAGKQVQSIKSVQQAAERARQSLTSELRGIRKVAEIIGSHAQVAITRAKAALVNLTARVFRGIAAERLFDTPVADLPTSKDPRVRGFTPQGKNMIGVGSSNVFSVGFDPFEDDPNTGTLYIQFRSGWIYKYREAPRWLYEGLLEVRSPGQFVWRAIRRGLYPDSVPYGDFEADGYTRIK